MAESNNANRVVDELAELLDIPLSYYEKAIARYESIGKWMCRPESRVKKFNPVVSSQGSFRLGTVNRPLAPCDEYDLDAVIELPLLAKTVLTQKQLKELVGSEIKLYAAANSIKSPVIERKRCWRLDYADDVNFHIDNLPCVPEDAAVKKRLIELGVDPALAALAIALTCKSHPLYESISSSWPTSNPSGYAIWFEGRMGKVAEARRRQIFKEGMFASVEKIPIYRLKTPLQRAIQILKRHRDVMFMDNPELQPISMMITTLAAHAYGGEEGLYDAVHGILGRMLQFVSPQRPRVENPVNPGEDFADKWASNPQLELNFRSWHAKAVADFETLANEQDVSRLRRLAEQRLKITLPIETANKILGSGKTFAAPSILVTGGPRPWGSNG